MEPKLDYSRLIEYEAGEVPRGKRIPLQTLLKQSRQRWYFDTSVGRVYLKRITQLDMDRISIEVVEEHPEFVDIVRRLTAIAEIERAGGPIGVETKEEALALGKQLYPLTNQFSRACFVTYVCERCAGKGKISWAPPGGGMAMVDCPKCRSTGEGTREVVQFNTSEEYDAFISALKPEEVEALYPILADLSSARLPGEVAGMGVVLAKEFDIPLTKDIAIDTMTAQQGTALSDLLERKMEAIRNMKGGK
jgi:hypothetical protein